MKKTIEHMMNGSKLTSKGSLSESRKHLNHKRRLNDDSINFVVIPKADGYKLGKNNYFYFYYYQRKLILKTFISYIDSHNSKSNSLVSEFGGLSSFEKCIKYLQRELLGVKRNYFTTSPSTFTEKKW